MAKQPRIVKIAPAYKLLIMPRSEPLWFDVVDANSERPQPIIGRAEYKSRDFDQGLIHYVVTAEIDGVPLKGELAIRYSAPKRKARRKF